MLLHPSQGKFSDRLFVCIRHRPAEVKWRLGRSGEVFSLRRLVEAKPGSVRPGLHPLELAWIRAGSLEFPQKQFKPKSVFNGCRWSLVRPYVKAVMVQGKNGNPFGGIRLFPVHRTVVQVPAEDGFPLLDLHAHSSVVMALPRARTGGGKRPKKNFELKALHH